MADESQEKGAKKKRRVLKRVLKKDKAKGFKPKRSLNTSLSNLSKSLNKSVTSMVIKQTLQSNNRQLAMTLERTRQELRLSNSIIMEQKREIVDLQTQVSTYKYLAGLKPEEIEHEVQARMEKHISDLKTYLGKMGQQLLDATTSLGEAMDLCMNVSRRSVGSCRTSNVSAMSDDEADHQELCVRPPLPQTQALQSDPGTSRTLPQRVPRLDMSVITEQSILLDDTAMPMEMGSPLDMLDECQETPVQEADMKERRETIVLEDHKSFEKGDNSKTNEEKGDKCEPSNDKSKDKGDKHESMKDKSKKTDSDSQIKKDISKNKEKSQSKDVKEIKCNEVKENLTKEDSKVQEKESDEESKKVNGETKEENGKKNAEKKKSRTKETKMSSSRSKNRRETYVLVNDEQTDTNPKQKGSADESSGEDKASENEDPDQQVVSVVKEDTKMERKRKEKVDRRGTFVLPSKDKPAPSPKTDRRGTFVLPSKDKPALSPKTDRRGTFVLSSSDRPVMSSKSAEEISEHKTTERPKSSKSETSVIDEKSKRKTFVVPDACLMPPPPVGNLKKVSPNKMDTEVTEYFNCDMELTEVIDHSNRIVVEPENSEKQGESSKVNSHEPSKEKGHKSSSNKNKAEKTDKEKVKCQTTEVKVNGKDQTSTNESSKDKMADAVEFRLPKPGKIVFAASRKTFDGKREPVPTKLPQRSRSKSKVKLTKSTSDESDVKSMFDFHEKTPRVLKQGSSVYNLSMDESVHVQDTYGAFRDKMNKPDAENKVTEETSDSDKSTKENDDVNSKQKPNNKGEIIYHLPLKGCSPDSPKVKSRSKSKGRERSQSRGRSKAAAKTKENENETENDKVSRSRSRGRSRSRKDGGNTEEDKPAEIKRSSRSQSRGLRTRKLSDSEASEAEESKKRSRSKKRSEEEENENVEVDNVPTRRSRSRARSKARINYAEDDDDEEEDLQGQDDVDEVKVSSRSEDDSSRKSRSKARSKTKINYSENEESDGECAVQEKPRSRSKSRGRSKTRNNKLNVEDDPLESGFLSIKTIARSKSRGRSKSQASDKEVDKGSESKSSSDEVKVDIDVKIRSEEQDIGRKLKSNKSRSHAPEVVESETDSKARSKSLIVEKILGSDDDFRSPKKSAKKKKMASKSDGVKSDLNPLDKLFKNAKKKSFSELDFDVLSAEENEPSDILISKNRKGSVSDVAYNQVNEARKEIVTDESEPPLNLQCITKRNRSRSRKFVTAEDLEEFQSLSKEIPHTEKEGISSEATPQAETETQSLDIEKSAKKDKKGKRRHDSGTDPTTEKKKKKVENKENTAHKASSLSTLKKRLASLGPKTKPEVASEPENYDIQSCTAVPGSPLRDVQNFHTPVVSTENLVKRERESHGSSTLTTPNVDTQSGSETSRSRRRGQPVSYKEMSVNVKLRREDVLQGKKLKM